MWVRDELARCRSALDRLTPRQILAVGFVAFLLYAFPGYMSTDSVVQLHEARTGILSDAHPPIMAKEWGLLDSIVAGPLLMIVLQASLFLAGVYGILRRVLDPKPAAWTASAILVFPPVLTVMAVVWKDAQMAAYLLAGTAAMIQPRLRTRLLGLGLYVVACALRHNAFAAVVPLVFFLFEWKPGIRWWKRVVILVVATGLTLGLTYGVTRALTVNHVKLTPVLTDIGGMIAVGKPRSDAELEELLRGTPLAVHENIQGRAHLLFIMRGQWRFAGGADRLFDLPTKDEQWRALWRAWKQLVSDEPSAYLASHWDRFNEMIVSPRATVWNLFVEIHETQPAYIHHDAGYSWIQGALADAFNWMVDYTPLFEPWIYLVIALALLALACRDRLTAGLYISGLLYEASYFPVGIDPDYRYSHWAITSVVIATVILFVQRKRART